MATRASRGSGEGVAVAGDAHAAVRKRVDSMPAQFSSTAQDLARGKPTGIDHLNGLIVRRGGQVSCRPCHP